MNIGNVIKRNSNLSNFNNKKGMLTATIEQKCSASIKHRAYQSAAHTHNNSESLLDHFVKWSDWTSSTEITVARPI